MNLQVFYINLDKRADRRAFMAEQFRQLGIDAERVSATTPQDLPKDALKFCDERRDRWVAPVELSCTYSHRKVWQMMLDRGLPGAIVFEDDAVLSSQLARKMGEIIQALETVDVIRLETRLMPVLLEGEDGGWLRRIYSFHYGSAGYAISRHGAMQLLACGDHDLPIDDYLFSPDGPMFGRIVLRQAYPGLSSTVDCVSGAAAVSASDISSEGSRRATMIHNGRHRVSGRALRYALRRIGTIATTKLQRTFGPARNAMWLTVPFHP